MELPHSAVQVQYGMFFYQEKDRRGTREGKREWWLPARKLRHGLQAVITLTACGGVVIIMVLFFKQRLAGLAKQQHSWMSLFFHILLIYLNKSEQGKVVYRNIIYNAGCGIIAEVILAFNHINTGCKFHFCFCFNYIILSLVHQSMHYINCQDFLVSGLSLRFVYVLK